MALLTCNACNTEFNDESERNLHYRSEWHRYNLKRKVAGVPGVTEELFNARQSALDREQNMLNAAPMSYTCALCNKEYRSEKAHAQHLNSRSHTLKASKESCSQATAGITIIKPRKHTPNKSQYEGEESGDEWVEVDPNDDMDESDVSDADDMDIEEELDTSCCFVCDLKHDNIENCMAHMHKHHGFYIPDVEYLKDPNGLLTYVGLKVKKDFMCLYCNRLPFQSLEAVRKHMIAKSHCKIRYGDGCDDEEAEFEEFYDYSSSYMDGDEQQLVEANGMTTSVELGCGGSEIIVKQNGESRSTVKRFGSREFLRYYRQKPRPSPSSGIALAVSLASRYRSMGLATVQSKEQMVKMKVVKEMNRRSLDSMHAKIGMKSNVIKNLPRNVPH